VSCFRRKLRCEIGIERFDETALHHRHQAADPLSRVRQLFLHAQQSDP